MDYFRKENPPDVQKTPPGITSGQMIKINRKTYDVSIIAIHAEFVIMTLGELLRSIEKPLHATYHCGDKI